jgi:RNA polymerase-binding transcription factor
MMERLVHASRDVNTDKYRQRLLELELEITERIATRVDHARELADAAPVSASDRAVDDEIADEELTEAELDWRRLRQVRDALRRIDDGTYGRCIVDGQPIDEIRLQAVPWARYCRQHQQEIESRRQMRTPTL